MISFPKVCVGLVLAAMPLQASAKASAPDYYVQALFDVSMAEQLALSCSQVNFNTTYAVAASEQMFEQLAADDIEIAELYESLDGVDVPVGAMMQDFAQKYGLDAPSEAKVCIAARQEISDASSMGAYLQEVAK